jgi:hypothetical protein
VEGDDQDGEEAGELAGLSHPPPPSRAPDDDHDCGKLHAYRDYQVEGSDEAGQSGRLRDEHTDGEPHGGPDRAGRRAEGFDAAAEDDAPGRRMIRVFVKGEPPRPLKRLRQLDLPAQLRPGRTGSSTPVAPSDDLIPLREPTRSWSISNPSSAR